MAEEEKESASAQSKSKKGLLDEDIGNEFLSSWKSMSVTEDDGMDFSFETIGKGKRNGFNFDKLDMEFNLDGDFGKLSSFKVDMPDIDFSCLPKKIAKANEGSAEESSVGKGGKKEDAFSFSFDFNEMDNFDFGSSLSKGGKTPKKDSTAKDVALVKLDNQGANIPLSGDSADCVDDSKKLPTGKSVEASETGHSEISTDSKLSPLRTNSSESATFGVKAPQNGERASLDKKLDGTLEETDQQGDLLKKGLQRTHAPNEDIMNTEGGLEPQNEACSLGKVSDSKAGRNQSICGNMVNEEMSFPENIQSMGPPASDSMNSLNDARRNPLGIGTRSGSIDGGECAQGQSDIEDVPTSDSLKKTQDDVKFEKQDENLAKKLDPAMVNREPRANQMMLTSYKEPVHVCSKFFKGLGDAGTQLDEAPRLIQLGSKIVSATEINLANEKRGETCKDTGLESKLVNNSDKIPRVQKRGLYVAENSRSVSSGHKTGSKSSETSNIMESQAVVGPESTGLSTEGLRSSKIKSLDRSKLQVINARATRNLSSLSIERAPETALEQLASRPLAGATSTKTSKEVIHSQSNSATLTPHPGGKSEKEKQLTLTPSLKRKTYETPNTSMIFHSPLKRLSRSPVESRSSNETSPKLVFSGQTREVSCNSGHVKSRNALDTYSPQVETPIVKNMIDYEFTASVENDGNLGKAEGYTKELEDLCNMLKKKQEEAKELLVRAVVNNNQLLMLNHPIFEEKICNVQKLASRLIAARFCS